MLGGRYSRTNDGKASKDGGEPKGGGEDGISSEVGSWVVVGTDKVESVPWGAYEDLELVFIV